MALDRLIRLTIRARGTRDDEGNYIPGDLVFDQNIWVEQLNEGTTYELDVSGGFLRAFRNRTYNARFLAQLLLPDADGVVVAPSLVQVFDRAGRDWRIISFGEVGERRRYMEIEVRREQV